MVYNLSIPAELQYGRIDPGDARPGRLQRAMQQVLIKALVSKLDDSKGDGASGDDPDKLPPRFEQALARFSGELAALDWGKSKYGKLWQRLLDEQRELEMKQGPQTRTDSPARSEATGAPQDPLIEDDNPSTETRDTVAERTERALFCLTLYGLCGAFAAQHLERAESEDIDDQTDGQAREEAPETVDMLDIAQADTTDRSVAATDIEEALVVKRAFAQKTVSELLARSLPPLSDEDNPDEERARRNLLSGVLLQCCRKAMADWVKEVAVEKPTAGNQAKKQEEKKQEEKSSQVEYCYVLTDEDIAARFERVAIDLPFSLPPQPLRQPVQYPLDPNTQVATEEGDFRVNLISYRRQNSFLRRLHAAAAEQASPRFKHYVEAVNAQMAVGWRLNLPLLDAVRSLMDLAQTGNRADATALWAREALYLPSRTMPRRSYQRPAEFLDHPMMQAVLADLAERGEDGSQPVFYLPWFADHRGRIYARTPWLTPQGGDVQRALLEFGEGRPLDEKGWAALRRYGANLVSKDRLTRDLGIVGRSTATMEEREEWVTQHEDKICASAADPVAHDFWRKAAAGSEFQFLAFCLAYRQAKNDPTAPVHLPVQIDGTCNGLQHIAALTGDRNLAQSVNVLENDTGLPRDIYTELAELARDQIRQGKSAVAKTNQLQQEIEEWLKDSGLLESLVSRRAAKKVIMTIPYGAGETAHIVHVLEHMLAKLESVLQDLPEGAAVERLGLPVGLAADARPPGLSDELKKALPGAFRRWLVGQRNRLYGRVLDEEARKAELQRLRDLRRLTDPRELELFRIALPLATVIVKHLQMALKTGYPSVEEFSGFLRKTADQLAGMPLMWTTPLDFPVLQNKFKLTGTHLDTAVLRSDRDGGTNVEKEPIRVDAKFLSDKVDADAAKAQRRALMPNIIHAFDATHLARTILVARDWGIRQIGSIHDCLLVHPNDADQLASVVRKTFAELHRADETGAHAAFADWCDWMELLRRMRISQRPAFIRGAINTPGHTMERLLDEADQALLSDLRVFSQKNAICASMINGFLAQSGSPLPAVQEAKVSLQFGGALFSSEGNSDQVSRYLFS